MSEGIALPALPRPSLLDDDARVQRLEEALPQIRAALSGETDAVALQATLACLLYETLVQCNWTGFYRRTAPSMLKVGPYQGSMGCLSIDFARGVCGACARSKSAQLVRDVHEFPGHIACDDKSRSELVLPVLDRDGELRAVLDLDSTFVAGFCERESALLGDLLRDVFASRGDLLW